MRSVEHEIDMAAGDGPRASIELDDVELDDEDVVEYEDVTGESRTEPISTPAQTDMPDDALKLFVEIGGERYPVDKDEFVIGRVSNSCDLTIVDANISRQHCVIERRKGDYYIRDLGSTNGIIFDGERVDAHLIREGHVYELSSHELWCTFIPQIEGELHDPSGIIAAEPSESAVQADTDVTRPPPPISNTAPPPPPRAQDAKVPKSAATANESDPSTHTRLDAIEQRLDTFGRQLRQLELTINKIYSLVGGNRQKR